MFELGARPHPPRSLYRAYLEQSDVFVGLYWEQYGWIAPGEHVSGLEDEYDLAPDIPMLIYVKRSDHRLPRLQTLLDRIRDDGRASYVSFGSSAELRRLLTSDLATLLAERFVAGTKTQRPPLESTRDAASMALVPPPSPLTRMLGREDELAQIVNMLTDAEARLITITGPGGIGKTRLAVAAAREAEASFPDGIAFVDLAPVKHASGVVSAIAGALGIRDTGDVPIGEKLVRSLADRRVLLVVDNVEHVVAAAADLSALLSSTGVTMLATSRALLRLDGEQNIPLHGLPDGAAIELFVERAQSSKPDFILTEENAQDVAAICSSLDNMPLALELAAARVRVLRPEEMLKRLDQVLSLLVGGNRDRPERQRTLRATIDWSADLLTSDERSLLLRMGIFRGGFSLDAVEWMNDGLSSGALDSLGALVDGSLVIEHERASRAWFTMLATVREYARDELANATLLDGIEERHAQYCMEMARKIEPELVGPNQGLWMARLVDEYDEIRATAEYLTAAERWDEVAEMLWALYPFWWVRSQLGEAGVWLRQVLQHQDDISDHSLAVAEFFVTSIAAWKESDPNAVADLEHSAAAFHRSGDSLGESFALATLAVHHLMSAAPDVDAAERSLERARAVAEAANDAFGLGAVALMVGRLALVRGLVADANLQFDSALTAARSLGDQFLESVVLNHMAWARVLASNLPEGAATFRAQILISASVSHDDGVAWALEGLFAVSAAAGDVERAGKLLGAADAIRERKGLFAPVEYSFHHAFLQQIESGAYAAAFEDARQAGRRIDLSAAVELALA